MASPPICVDLAFDEIAQAAMSGVFRQTQNIKRGLRNAYGASGNDWQLHIEGALGECAAAKALDLYWGGKGRFAGGDIGQKIQVRTRSDHGYDLIVHPRDPDDAIFILVTGTNGSYVVRGWIRGGDAKKKEWWRDPAGGRPAYFVPQSSLSHVSTLPVRQPV